LPLEARRTWRYTPHISPNEHEFAFLYTGGTPLDEVCPEAIKSDFLKVSEKLKAYLRSFDIAKVSLDENCFYDLVPDRFLLQYFDLKNQITQHVFENYDRPKNYDFLSDLDRLLSDISHQPLCLDKSACYNLYSAQGFRSLLKAIKANRTKVEYNIFGTRTGRLATTRTSFPILTIKKQFRQIIKPQNDCFVELDFNAAELRTLLALSGKEQPEGDLHEWNCEHVYRGSTTREEAKKRIFAWLYNPDSTDYLSSRTYNRDEILDKYWDGSVVTTPFGRTIPADRHHALNYIVQSTASDLFLRRAIEVDKILEKRQSRIAFFLHDSLVIDLSMGDISLLGDMVKTFSNTDMGEWKTNASVGDSFGHMKRLQWTQ